jgi:hypothetical protein
MSYGATNVFGNAAVPELLVVLNGLQVVEGVAVSSSTAHSPLCDATSVRHPQAARIRGIHSLRSQSPRAARWWPPQPRAARMAPEGALRDGSVALRGEPTSG